jgi:prepilin-type processing-associated H-X9-DG protein
VFALPLLEQASLFNAINQSLVIIGAENSTAHSVVVTCLACPSDPASGIVRNLSQGQLAEFGVSDPARMVFTSYAGLVGSLPVVAQPMPSNGCAVAGPLIAQSNGVFNDLGLIRLSSVADGLSNTIFLAEKSTTVLGNLGALSPSFSAKHGWYITGNWGDTLVTALYPPNAYKRVNLAAGDAWADSASSLHAGGVNVAMGDGSVGFISESIQSWVPDSLTGDPTGASVNAGGWWVSLPPPGVWQALSTRSGGELVDSVPH